MSFVNDIRIIGEIIEDAKINSGTNSHATIKIKTGRPFKGTDGKTSWEFQTHTVKCYKDEAFGMIKTHAKKGKWMKVLGELSYGSNGATEILVRKTTGDIGMMFDALFSLPQENQEKNNEIYSNSTHTKNNGFIESSFSNDEDDEIPF